MKRLKFSEPLTKLILDGRKCTTWRIDDDKNISVGDELSLCYKNGEEFAKSKVIWVRETTFENLKEEDKEEHEIFSSEKEMYQTYSGYYKMNIGPKTKVKIIKFKLL